MHNPIYYQFGTLCTKYVQAVAVQLCSVLALHLSQMFLSLPLDDLAIDLGSIMEGKKSPPHRGHGFIVLSSIATMCFLQCCLRQGLMNICARAGILTKVHVSAPYSVRYHPSTRRLCHNVAVLAFTAD